MDAVSDQRSNLPLWNQSLGDCFLTTFLAMTQPGVQNRYLATPDPVLLQVPAVTMRDQQQDTRALATFFKNMV